MQQNSEPTEIQPKQQYVHDRHNIFKSLHRLYKRRICIESGQFVLHFLLLFSSFLFVSSILLSYSFPKESVYLTLVLLSVPLFYYLRKVGDFFEDNNPMHSVARRLEVFDPRFQGNLIVVVEDVRGAAFLKARAAQQSISTLSSVSIPAFLPLTKIKKLLFYVFASVCLLFILENRLMIGPSSVWSAFSSGYGVKQKDVKQSDVNVDHEVIIGDITLTYDFPEYTGLGQITVKNSDGTIHAPIGTSVLIQAKSEQNYDTASFIVNEDEPVEFTLRNNREIEGNIEITKAGNWKFQMSRKNTDESQDVGDFLYFSSSYDLEVDGDTPPVVTVDGERDMLTSANRPIPLRWKAKDDYGIERVLVEWVDLDTPLDQELQMTESRIISMPKDTPLFLESKFKLRPDQLDLQPGDEVRLRIVAYDGQAPSEDDLDEYATSSTDENAPIGKRGESIDIIVRVATPEMLGRKLIEFHEKLLDVLLDALAPTLTESLPIDNISKGEKTLRKEMIAHSINIRNRYADIEQIYREHWGNAPTKDISQELISNILQRTGRLMRLISTTYGEDVAGRIIDQDHKNVREATSELINDHERAIYLIDYMLREIAFIKMRETAQKLSEQGYQFEKRKAKEAEQRETEKRETEQKDGEDSNEQLDEEQFQRSLSKEFEENISLERNIEKLLSFNQKLSSSGIQEYVKSRGEEAKALQQNLKQKLQQVKDQANPNEESLQEIDAMQRQLNQDLQDLSSGIDELFQRQQQDEEDLQQQMEDLIKQLEELQANEERLAEDLANSRKTNDPNRDQLASIWDRIIQITERNMDLHKSVLEDTEGGIGFRSDSISTLERLESHLAKLNNTSRSRDPEKVFRSIEQVERYLYFSQARIETERNRYRPSNQQEPQNIEQIISKLDQISSGIQEIRQLLEQTSDYSQESAYMQQKAMEQLAEQQSLSNKATELHKGVQKLEAELPTADGSASELMKEAQDSMKLSENYLGQGNSISGEGLQRDAAYKIEAAKEKLLEQQQQMQQMQQQMQQMSSSQQGSGSGSGGESSEESESMSSSDIPNVEEKMSLEEYRRMILQGLNAKVPEEYESLRRRYFEELIQE